MRHSWILVVGVMACEAERPLVRDRPIAASANTAQSSRVPCEPATTGTTTFPYRAPSDFRGWIEPDGTSQLETPTSFAKAVGLIEAGYTEPAIQNRVQGVVIVAVGIRADGGVAGVRVMKGLPCGLEAEAIDAVERATFSPATRDGRPIDSILMVPVEFRLPDGQAASDRE